MRKGVLFLFLFLFIITFTLFAKNPSVVPKQDEPIFKPDRVDEFIIEKNKIDPLLKVKDRVFNKAVHLENSPVSLTVYHYADGWWPSPKLYYWNESTSSWVEVSKSSDYNDGYVTWMVYNVTFPKLPIYVYFDTWWTPIDDNDGDLYYISDIDIENGKTWVFDGFIYSKNPNYQSYAWFSKNLYWYAYTVWADEIRVLDSQRYEFKGNVNIYGTPDGSSFEPVLKYKFDKLIVSYDQNNARLKIIDGNFRLPSGYGLPYFIQDGRIRGVAFDVDSNRIISGDNSINLSAFTPGDPSTTQEISGIRASLLDSSRKKIYLKGKQSNLIKDIEMDYQGYIYSLATSSNRVSITLGNITFTADYINVDECGHYHLSGSITCSAGSFVFNDLEIIYFDDTKRITLASGTLNVGVAELTLRNVVIDALTGFVIVGGGTLTIPEIKFEDFRLSNIVADFSWEGFHCRARIENSIGTHYVEFFMDQDGAISSIVEASMIQFSIGETTISAQWILDFGNGHYSIGGNATIEGIYFNFENLDFVYNDIEHTITLKRGEIKFPNTIFATVSDVVYNLDTHEVTFGQLTVGIEEFQINNGLAAGLIGDFYPDHLHVYGRLNATNGAFQIQFDLSYEGVISNLTIGAQLQAIQFGNLVISADTWISPQAGIYIFSGNVQIEGFGFTFNQLQITYNSSQHTIYLNYGELRLPYFTATVQNVLIDVNTKQILDGSGKVSIAPFKIGGYQIVSLTASFDKYFIEVDASVGTSEVFQSVSGIRIHFKIDYKGNIYSIGGGITGEIPLGSSGVSIYNPYIQIDNENGFIENGGLNRNGWIIILMGSIAPTGSGTYLIAEDFTLIVEPSIRKFTLNGILRVGGNPIANSSLMVEPNHVYTNVYSTIRIGDSGNFEVHAEAWLDFYKDSSNTFKRSGAGSGYIAYRSNRVVNSSFIINETKLYGQATVSILNDWIDFCLTYELYNNGTLNITWSCPPLEPASDPCGQNDPYPSCASDLIAEVTNDKIVLHWNPAKDNKGISYYRIYKNGSPYGVVYNTTLSFTDTNIESGQYYTYEVHPLDTAYQEQTGCKEIKVKAGNSNLTLFVNKNESNNIILSWSGDELPEYIVYRSSTPYSFEEILRTPSNTIIDPKTPSGLVYYVIQQIDR